MKSLKMVYLVAFLMLLGFSTGGLLLPLLADSLKISPSEIGFLFFISNITSGILRIPVGLMSDKFGRRSFVLSAAILMATSGVLFISSKGFIQLMLPFIIWGAVASFYFTVSVPLVADLTQENEMVKALRMVGIVQNLAIIIGVFLAGVVADLYSLKSVFIILIASSVILILASFKLPETNDEKGKSSISLKKVATGKIEGITKFFALLSLIHGTYAGMLWTMYPIFFRGAYHLTYLEISLINVALMTAQAIGFHLSGRSPFNLNSRLLMVISTLSSAVIIVSCVGVGLSFWFFPLFFIFGFVRAFDLLSPISNSIFMKGLEESRRGTARGITGTVWRIGMAIGSTVMGKIWTDFGMIAVFYVSTALLILEAAIMWITMPKNQRGVLGR